MKTAKDVLEGMKWTEKQFEDVAQRQRRAYTEFRWSNNTFLAFLKDENDPWGIVLTEEELADAATDPDVRWGIRNLVRSVLSRSSPTVIEIHEREPLLRKH